MTSTKRLASILAAFLLPAAALAEVEKVAVPLSDPAKPAQVEVALVAGSIHVEGYDGQEVLVEMTTALERVGEDDAKEAKEEKAKEEKAKEEKAKREEQGREGLRRVAAAGAGLTVEEEENVVEIRTDSWNRAVDLAIKVPRRTSLRLKTINHGEIVVHGVEGEHEFGNVNGGVEATGIKGSVVAQTVNGDVLVRFDAVAAGKAMSFSSLNGDLDVTFPPGLKADLRMRSDQGEVLTDFDFNAQPATNRVQEGDEEGGFRLKIEKEVRAQVGGGGPEIAFKTFNGDILIRKGRG